MIRIEDLSFAYPGGDFRLSIPRLVLQREEKVAVVGPSGTGKSTLLNLIAGIALPKAGTVTVGDQTISRMNDAARRAPRASKIGFIFQDFALLEYLTARENILLPYRIAAGSRLDAAARSRAEELAGLCGLEGKLDRRPEPRRAAARCPLPRTGDETGTGAGR